MCLVLKSWKYIHTGWIGRDAAHQEGPVATMFLYLSVAKEVKVERKQETSHTDFHCCRPTMPSSNMVQEIPRQKFMAVLT